MENKKLIEETYNTLSAISMDRTKENASIVLRKINNLMEELCPKIEELECDYYRNRYYNLYDAMSYETKAFEKVYYATVSEVRSKLKVIMNK